MNKALPTKMVHLTKRFVVSQNEAYMYLGSSTSLHTCKLQHIYCWTSQILNMLVSII
jgi:hypothetical protein